LSHAYEHADKDDEDDNKDDEKDNMIEEDSSDNEDSMGIDDRQGLSVSFNKLYLDKWLAMAEDAKEPALADGDKKKKTKRRRGKFTGANEKTGQCKWGGCTTE
jgi:predicted AAA+ superfamily ATPase